MCKHCKGFWKSKRASSRFVQIGKGKRVSLQLILDEPPQDLYNRWIKSRIAWTLQRCALDIVSPHGKSTLPFVPNMPFV